MSLSVQIGLLFAVATAVASVVGFLYKHRGAIESPDIEWSRPVRTTLALFRNGWFALGVVIATLGWGFHVAALALAPISIVQSVIAGGLVFLTVIADRAFGHKVTRREWVGVGLAALGLAFLAATLGDGAKEEFSAFEYEVLIVYLVIVLLGAGLLAWWGDGRPQAGVLLGLSAGAFWAGSDTAIKAATDRLDTGFFGVLIHPLALVIAVASIIGLIVSSRSLQIGKAVPVIAMTSIAANSLTIASGPIVFGEPFPDDVLGVILRISAFALVIGAAALTPAPVRAAEGEIQPATT